MSSWLQIGWVPRRPAELDREEWRQVVARANRLTAERTLPGVFLYPLGILVLAFASSLWKEHPRLVLGVLAFMIIAMGVRLQLHRRLNASTLAAAESWQTATSVLVLASAFAWGAFAAATVFYYGVTWPSFLALLGSAGMCGGGMAAFGQNLVLSRGYTLLMLGLPTAAALASGAPGGRGAALLMLLYCGYIWTQSRILHREYWQGLVKTKLLEVQAAELREARDDAERASRAKSDFLANTSHEIRTPLNAILGFAEILGTAKLPERESKLVAQISASGEDLLDLLNELLDLSRIEAGELLVELVRFNPASAVEKVCALLGERAAAKGLELTVGVSRSLDRELWGDRRRLEQILLNLVSNAVRFTESGGVRVTAQIQDSRGDVLSVAFAVTDTGPGIAEGDRKRLFEPFFQVDASSTRRFGGTGLGLAISARLATVLGGRISVTSEPGEGSTFLLLLPLYLSPQTASEDLASAAQEVIDTADFEVDRASMRILVIEDNEINRTVAKLQLEALGFRPTVAASGAEGLLLFEQSGFDAVLMDCQMPELDGFETTRRLRRIETPGTRVPVVALTAAAMREARDQCMEAGMDHFLAKPVKQRDLEEVLLRCFADVAASPAQAPAAEVPASEDQVVDERQLERLAALGETSGGSVLHTLVQNFTQRTPQLVDRLRQAASGRRGVELERTAHLLKGNALNLGATGVSTVCDEIESAAAAGDLETAAERVDTLELEVEKALARLLRALDQRDAESTVGSGA